MMMYGDEWDWRYGVRPRPDARQKFKTFLRMSAKSEGLISNVIETLEPIFKISGVESYPWKPAHVVTKENVAEAARRLSNREVSGIEIVSISKLAFFGWSLLQENFQERLVAEVDRGSLCYTTGELLSIDFGSKKFAWRFMEDVRARFLEALWSPFGTVLETGTEKVNRGHGVGLKWPALATMMYYYICCGILSDNFARTTMFRYEAVLKLLGQGVILWGEERGATGVWFALAG